MPAYQPLTIQFRDRTCAGEWMADGQTLRVRCSAGEVAKALSLWIKPLPQAERLLLDLLKENGQL